MISKLHIEGILPKGPYLPCVSMAVGPFWQDTLDITSSLWVETISYTFLTTKTRENTWAVHISLVMYSVIHCAFCCALVWFSVSWFYPLRWRHNGFDSVSNHQPHHCLLNRLFRRRSKKTSQLPVTGLWAGNSPETGEFPAQMASNAEKVSIWWRHHVYFKRWLSSAGTVM